MQREKGQKGPQVGFSKAGWRFPTTHGPYRERNTMEKKKEIGETRGAKRIRTRNYRSRPITP